MFPVLKTHFADCASFRGTPGNRVCHYPHLLLGPLWIAAKAVGRA